VYDVGITHYSVDAELRTAVPKLWFAMSKAQDVPRELSNLAVELVTEEH
jgi:hypothetical protein